MITDNRASMPGHVAELLAAGRHHWGIFTTRAGITLREIVEEMILIWEASEAEEWVDVVEWIPLR